eukprot:COSAG06_NODE_1786_length_8400_cov_4.794121_4_plen_77_part_00
MRHSTCTDGYFVYTNSSSSSTPPSGKPLWLNLRPRYQKYTIWHDLSSSSLSLDLAGNTTCVLFSFNKCTSDSALFS